MKDDFQKIKLMLSRDDITEIGDNDLPDGAEEKLAAILSKGDRGEEWATSAVRTVCEFMGSGDVARRKVLSYCMDFVDPTRKAEKASDDGISRHDYLTRDELLMLKDMIKIHHDDSFFGEVVYSMIEEKGMEPPEVYNNVFMSRQTFSRITRPGENVTRKMAWLVVIGLHCNLEEADEVLFSAGYIRRNTIFDMIMKYFIETENYDIMAIDEVLSKFDIEPFVRD